MQSSLEK